MHRFTLLIAFVFITHIGIAQLGNLKGTIRFNDSHPAIGVLVSVKEINKNTITDENGEFDLTVPYGSYTLETSSIEAEDKSIFVRVDASFVPINITLEQASKTIEHIVIVKETPKAEIEKKGFAVNVIETKQASLRNLQTLELLNRTVGVRIRQNGGLGSDSNFNINGISGNGVRVFVDGTPISTYGSSFDLNSIPPSMIERIEVYKGVIPGYLSEDALGGAINVVLKKTMRNNLNVGVSYGSFNTAQANFSGLYRTKESGFTVKASGFWNYSDNDYKVWGKMIYNTLPNGQQQHITAKRFNDAFRSVGGVFEIGYTDVKWADNFFVGLTASDSYNEIQHGVFMTDPYKGRFVESDAMLFNVTYNKKNLLAEGLDLTVHGIYGERNRMVNDTVKWAYNWDGAREVNLYGEPVLTSSGAQQGAPTLANIHRDVFSLRTGFSYAINDNHKFLLNNLYNTIDRVDDDEIRTVLERNFMGTRNFSKSITSVTYEFNAWQNRLKTSLFGKLYNQEVERMNPVVESINGVNTRVEDIAKKTISTEGYGIALSYVIIPKITLLTSAEKAVRLPTENEIFGDAGDNMVENVGLKPEESKNFNLGFRLGQFNYNKHDFNFAVNGFSRSITDRIATAVQTSINTHIQVLPSVNQGNVRSKGFDFEFDYTYDNNFRLMFNTSKFDLTTKDYYNREMTIPNEPLFTINTGAQYSFKDILGKGSQLNVFYHYMFVDEFFYLLPPGSNNTGYDFFKIPQQDIHDVGLSYVFPNKKIILSFDAKNIFDKQAFDNMGVQKPGRAFYLKLNYVINNI